MTTLVLALEHHRIDSHTRRATVASLVAHALVLAWLAVQPHVMPGQPVVTEITWLDPGSLSPGIPQGTPEPRVARGPEVSETPEPGTPSATPRPQHLERAEAEFKPSRESARAIQDRLAARLASLQGGAHADVPRTAALYAPEPVPGATHGPSDVSKPAPVLLARGSGGSGSAGGGAGNGGAGGGRGLPLPLLRASHGGLGLPAVPQLATPAFEPEESGSARPQDVDRTHVRKLAGASLMGPVADRPLLSYEVPAFPEWAKREGVEASVSLYFVVRPDGRIRENIQVEKTSGFEDFDARGIEALRSWRFATLGPGATGEQWGRITFHFRLRDAG